MLTSISLQNFKCYQDKTEFNLGKINLLTGINGKGKSTFLQSLLLFRQSVEHDKKTTDIYLNGTSIRLGEFSDVKNINTSAKRPILISFTIDYKHLALVFQYNFVESLYDKRLLRLDKFGVYTKGVEKVITNDPENVRSKHSSGEIIIDEDGEYVNSKSEIRESFHELFPFFTALQLNATEGRTEFHELLSYQKIHYISADRLGPQEFYTKNNMGDFVHVGKQGELVADVLSYAKREQLVVDSDITRSPAKDVLSQTGEWLSFILDNSNLSVRLDDDDKYRSSIIFRMNGKDYTPPNVGFGYSYVLPIIVAGLIASEGDILIVENPEAHLHPKAQSHLAHFLAKLTHCGVQVFIESHSDHILNALRVSTKKGEIKPEDIKVFFFGNNEDLKTTSPKIFTPTIDEDGRIDEWPDGFFDEWSNNLIELL